MKRARLVVLLGLTATAQAALGPRYGGRLVVGVLELPSAFDPAPPASDGARLVAGLVGETLIGLTPEGRPAPALARSWSASAAAREWTLQLREGARFHDGPPASAADAVRSLRRFLRGPGSAAESLARSLDGGRAFRARTTEQLPGLGADGEGGLHLRLSAGSPPSLVLYPLASPAAAITGESGAGAGPFLPTMAVSNRRIAFTAFAGHVRGRPFLDQVEVRAFGDRDALREARRTQAVDSALEDAGSLRARLLLRLDPGKPPFDRREARTAIAAAIDRAELVSRLIPGGEPTSSLLWPPRTSRSFPPPAPLRLAGRLTMAVGRDVPPLLSQRIVAHLGALGLAVDALPRLPSEVAGTTAEARLFLFFPEVAEPGLALEELAALSLGPSTAREALEAAAREDDPARRRLLLRRAEEALRAEAVVIALAAFPLGAGGDPSVHGLRLDETGRLVLEDAWREP